jgi:hypothetical protein
MAACKGDSIPANLAAHEEAPPMPAYRSIRIQMPDRPGALSAISTALAVHGVDIVRLDVVSHPGNDVVDDLFLSGASQEVIGQAVGSFQPDVIVRTFDQMSGDPTLEMGLGLTAAARASTASDAFEAVRSHGLVIGRADTAAVARATPDGGFSFTAGPAGSGSVAADEPFPGRYALARQEPLAFPADNDWAPGNVQTALQAAWVAMAPLGPFDLLVLCRQLNIAYLSDELERIGIFAEASGAVLQLRGDIARSGTMHAVSEPELPRRAVTMSHVKLESSIIPV